MPTRLAILTALALFAAAASAPSAAAQVPPDRPPPTPAAEKDIDPVGSYELTVVVQGQAIGSFVKIEKKDSTFTGTVSTEAYGTFTIAALKVSGKTITLSIYAADGSPVTISLTVEGDQVTGDWSMAGDGSKVTGKKVPRTDVRQQTSDVRGLMSAVTGCPAAPSARSRPPARPPARARA
ncbi:MAG TPA: hypothetical protein VIH11_05180 [Gemmatimonadaceae bacterium]|nr:hypothetical protein [Gemmatimonadaceae bacterium]